MVPNEINRRIESGDLFHQRSASSSAKSSRSSRSVVGADDVQHFFGGARNIRITGQPAIPDEIDLSANDELVGWTFNLYLDSTAKDKESGENIVTWSKSQSEIVGRKFESGVGRKRNALRYHRPLVEDSVVSYDFFYVPNETHTHPALGRMALLLEPDGVKLHWMTDAQWDRSGISPDTAIVEKAHQRGPAELPLKKNNGTAFK